MKNALAPVAVLKAKNAIATLVNAVRNATADVIVNKATKKLSRVLGIIFFISAPQTKCR